MTNITVKVGNLSKSYLVGHNSAEAERYTALRDVLARNVRSLARKTRDMIHGRAVIAGDEVEEFWALRDVSFEIRQGDRVGIIGPNGAGKSTLLKILSRITEPTKGRIELNGRVASLLEVGTGFHPELTGRENIFLNGAILGMTRGEIRRKFDEIVSFAEVERFLDTPVKRYSSGMYVRLAFAVAAHLEPEILIVDEVLAVGDSAFQKKCLGKMDEVARAGRTVLFVSHNMPAILSLCNRGILLERGMCEFDGLAQDAVERYLESGMPVRNNELSHRVDRKGNGKITFTDFELRDDRGRQIEFAQIGQKVCFVIHYISQKNEQLINVDLAIGVHGRLDENLFHLSTNVKNHTFDVLPANGKIICHVDGICLQPGTYGLNLFATINGDVADWIQNAAKFSVAPSDFFGTGEATAR